MRKWLLELRKKKELTQTEVAELCSMARATYSMIEIGERNASVSNAKKIAEVLDFDWTIFFEDKSHELQSSTKIKTG